MTLHVAPHLTEPLWHPQAGETALESQAFQAYLQTRSQPAVASALGRSAQDVGLMAVRWAWHERVMAYDRSIAQIGWEARAARARAVLAERADLMAQAALDAAKCVQLGLAYHREQFQRAPGTYSVREVVQLAALDRDVAERLVEWSRPSERQEADAKYDFDALNAQEHAELASLARKLRGI